MNARQPPVEPGDTQTPRARRMVVDPVVFGASAVLALLFVAYGALMPDRSAALFGAVQGWVVGTFGWFYVLSVAIFLVFAVYLALSAYGSIRLGPDDSVPEFSYLSWFAMLFSAGMGIGLMFFGVAEPLIHFGHPPGGLAEPATVEAAREAMRISFLHWGVHAWTIYIVVGMSLAYFSFRHGLPLTIRSSLYPLLGDRIHGPIGDAVDVFAVLGTLFGVATSLGFGALQVNAGLNYLFDIEVGLTTQLVLIAVITLIATGSVVAGLNAGIRRLSELNLFLAVGLLLFVLITGPTVFLLSTYLQNTGSYLSNVVDLTFRQFAYTEGEWMGSWTLFYWGWWIAWSPFVGMFIARISRGRTIREFVVGVIAVPTLFTFLWMTVFGNTAIHAVLQDGASELLTTADSNVPLALFALLETLPLASITSLVATVLVVTFFVTSADSGSLVIDMITSGGAENPPVWQRVFWALTQGVVAAVLLVAGGLGALQTAAIASGLPFSMVMLVICLGLFTALRRERVQRSRLLGPPLPVAHLRLDWRQRLAHLVRHQDHGSARRFLQQTVRPALESVLVELRGHGLEVVLEEDADHAVLRILDGEDVGFEYGVRLRSYRNVTFAFVETPAEESRNRHWFAEAWSSASDDSYDVLGLTREALIDDLLSLYSRRVSAHTSGISSEAGDALPR